MADWRDLDNELDAWQEIETPATFWWRDDDAIEPTEQLSRMLELVRRHSTSLALAVIPSKAKVELRSLIENFKAVNVLQHGFAHTNHSPSGEKRSELGPHRDQAVLMEELASGFTEIWKFKAYLPILVPPWNRIDSNILSKLPEIGYKGISTYTNRSAKFAAPGLVSVNAHVDIIDWPATRNFVGTNRALDMVTKHLKDRRTGMVDSTEPTGLLTHHLVHDEGCWTFIDEFLNALGNHGSARVISISEALTP